LKLLGQITSKVMARSSRKHTLLKNSTGHHGILSYHLGGLAFLVRHETDGYVEHLGTVSKK